MTTKSETEAGGASGAQSEQSLSETEGAKGTAQASPETEGESAKDSARSTPAKVSVEKGARGGRARKKSKTAEPASEGAAPAGPAPVGPARDETDSFIEEVTEELRRDRLYAMFRRYGPYALALILALVVGTAVNQYVQSVRTEEARRAGAALLAAQAADEPAAAYLSVAADTDPGAAMIARFDAAALRAEQGDRKTAASIYRSVAASTDLAPRFRDLALLKAAMVEADTADPQRLISDLAPLTAEGAPYRALALELQAASYLRLGDVQAAREALDAAMTTPQAPQNLIGRAQAVLDAIGDGESGGSTEAAPTDQQAPTD